MHYDILIPITLFICIAYSLKAVVDAYARRKIIESRGSEELVRALLEGETVRRRHASLQWGTVMVILSLGFGLVEFLDVQTLTPGVVAILLAATGLGNLAFYLIERKIER
ncbi:hypothetical protein ARC20_07665 [Stenotrophomonas panacihumi]|uniref:Transmembrane protein n=1 Tax=Stenotrophomonas panacihumi TaxID=676599 RepID=A0A0R0AJG0_9GAMM|nr:hypothetical protein [Stenotrophomonas panacihumi]KRG45261.1 hypothetical protein ARC20_07665 [Stenotrophomonas panacihumi]PTN55501.1 hypothetical protein C9J98_06630 [Stenotrophomonas panacihumi]